MSYSDHKIHLNEKQQKRVAKAVANREPFSIRLTAAQLSEEPNASMPLTSQQIKRLEKAEASKSGAQLNISKTQSQKIMRAVKKDPELMGSGIGAILASIVPSLIGPAVNAISSLFSKKGSGVFLAGEGHDIMDKVHGMHISEFLDACGVEVDAEGMIKKKL